jgi:hypothetical protein
VAAVKKAAEREVAAALDRAARAVDVGGLSDRQVIDLVRNSSMARHATAETILARQQRREELRSLIDDERENCERDGVDLQRRHREAIARRDAKAQELIAAEQAMYDAGAAIAVRTRVRNQLVARYETELEALIPPEVTRFCERCDAEWNKWRQISPQLPHFIRAATHISGIDEASPAPPEYTRKRKENAEVLDRHSLEGESFGAAGRAALALMLPEGSEELRQALEQIWENRFELAKAAREAAKGKS